MKVFTCKDHDSHYPVGAASVIVARTQEEAFDLLDEALIAEGLKPNAQKRYSLQELNTSRKSATILVNGEY